MQVVQGFFEECGASHLQFIIRSKRTKKKIHQKGIYYQFLNVPLADLLLFMQRERIKTGI